MGLDCLSTEAGDDLLAATVNERIRARINGIAPEGWANSDKAAAVGVQLIARDAQGAKVTARPLSVSVDRPWRC